MRGLLDKSPVEDLDERIVGFVVRGLVRPYTPTPDAGGMGPRALITRGKTVALWATSGILLLADMALVPLPALEALLTLTALPDLGRAFKL